MCTPGIPGRVRVQRKRGHLRSIERQSLVFSPGVRLGRGRLFTDRDSMAQRKCAGAPRAAVASRRAVAVYSAEAAAKAGLREGWLCKGGFTLIELLIVVGIIGLLLVLMAPAFTYIKGGTDVTSAAYTVKGVLDTACTYAKANNTYTWVGFYEENVANPASPNSDTPPYGRLVMSIVASKDGTNVATTNPIDPTKLIQVGKLTKIENVHLATIADGTNLPLGSNTYPGTTLDSRPTVAAAYCIGDALNSSTPFVYPLSGALQYTFVKAVQFSSSGEARVNNSTNSLQPAGEVGLRPTHGTAVDMNNPNVVAIQFTGVGGDVAIYRK